jgi:serine/threonine-protein kinase RsbW
MASPLRVTVRRTTVEAGVRVTLRLPSDVGCIEQVVALLERHCFAGTTPDGRLRFRLQVALSEALANAIVCGNDEDPAKRVLVEAEVRPETFRITITDEGRGFDPDALPNPLAPDRLEDTCGRGVFLIRKLVDHVAFNERGNSLCMTLRRR